jgi:hypothetical protein
LELLAEAEQPRDVRRLNPNDALQGLTSRQQLFVALMFSGLTKTEAYRQAGDCADMSAQTLGHRAAEMYKLPLVQAKLREMQSARDQQSTLAVNLNREWIKQGIMQLATAGDKDSVKLAAYIALGKVVGIDLFRETTRVERIERTPADIDRELEEQLKSMAKTIEGRVNDTVAQKPASARRGRKP